MSGKREQLTKALHEAVLLLMLHMLISRDQAKALKKEIDDRANEYAQ